MQKITTDLIEQIKNIDEPFNTDESVYLYLADNKLVDFNYDYFRKIMSIYNHKAKRVASKKKIDQTADEKISRIENDFCEVISHLKTKTIYLVYKSLYEQSLSNPDIALKFLKFYDRKEKKYSEAIKTRSTKKKINTSKNSEELDTQTINKNIDEINSLIKNPQKPNKINIPTAESRNDNLIENTK